MKSKLFLSVSLLTAFASIHAAEVFTTEGVPGLAPSYVAKLNAKSMMAQKAFSFGNKLGVAGTVVGLLGLAVHYLNNSVVEVQEEVINNEEVAVKHVEVNASVIEDVKNRKEIESSIVEDSKETTTWKNSITNAAIIAKENAVKAYDSAASFATKSAYHKVGTGAAALTLVGAVYYLIHEASN